MKKLVIAALAATLFMPTGLEAQNAITQEGTTLQNAPMMFRGNNRARQGAGVKGAPKGQIIETGDSVVGGRCDFSAPIDDPGGYYFLCVDAKEGKITSGGTKSPAKGLTFEINGATYTVPFTASFIGTDIAVANNLALQALNGTAGQRALRLGFATPGDGGLASYVFSGTNCAAADNGAQVQPAAGTGCWIADFSGTLPTPKIWGAKGDGTTDDTAAVQAAVNALQGTGRNLYLGKGHYLISATINVGANLNIIGEGVKADTYATACPASASSFIVNTAINALWLEARSAGVRGICFQMAAAPGTAVTNGAAIIAKSSPAFAARNDITDNSIIYPRVGIYVTGIPVTQNNGSNLRGNLIISPTYAGIEIGTESVNAGTVGLSLSDNQIVCFATKDDVAGTGSAVGILLRDGSPNALLGDGGPYGCNIGTALMPAASQVVMGYYSGVMGDTSKTADLYISPTIAGGKVEGASFVGFWASNARPGNTTDIPVWIDNKNGGTVRRIKFVGGGVHSNYAQTSPTIAINGATDILITGVIYIGTDPAGIIGPALHLINSSAVTFTGNHIPTDYQLGVELSGTTNDVTIAGNTILAGRKFAFNTVPSSMMIGGNGGFGGFCPDLAVANTVNLIDGYDCYKTVGNGEIWVMQSHWGGREVTIYAGGTLVLHNNGAPGEGICGANYSMAANESVRIKWNGGDNCWMRL